MKTAIIGLPQVGKTSLFTILTGVTRETRLGGTEVQVGVARVPDPRLDALARLFQRERVVHATVEYADMPALSKEVLRDPKYVASLRLVDAFAHVLRLFKADTVMHIESSIDPARDWKNLELELILNDLEVVEKRLERVEKDIRRMKNPELEHEKALLLTCQKTLESELPLRQLDLKPDDAKRLRGFQFLSEKPMLLVLNLGEAQAAELHRIERQYRESWLAGAKKIALAAICGSVESEIALLPENERREYLEGYGLKESGLERLVGATYSLLGLMSFLTVGDQEVHAWPIPRETPAVKAAGVVHSDFEKRFIRAEVIHWEKLVELGGYAEARRQGELRLEGKDYVVREGDVLLIRHG